MSLAKNQNFYFVFVFYIMIRQLKWKVKTKRSKILRRLTTQENSLLCFNTRSRTPDPGRFGSMTLIKKWRSSPWRGPGVSVERFSGCIDRIQAGQVRLAVACRSINQLDQFYSILILGHSSFVFSPVFLCVCPSFCFICLSRCIVYKWGYLWVSL